MILKKATRKLLAAAMTALLGTGLIQPVFAEEPYPEIIQGTASDYIYVFDTENGQVLSEKNSEERMYPASMTKIVTAIVALEHLNDMNRVVTITDEMLAGLSEANASVAGFAAGDEVTVRDLLYGVALPSGADCANALAFECAGSIESFVGMMNEFAQTLGLSGTHFTNTTGLHEDDHCSTAKEFAQILAYCIQNEDFVEIFSAQSYVSTPTQWYPSGIEMKSTTWIPAARLGISLDGMQCSKTGFTYEAGHCLIWWAKVNNMSVVGVNAHSDEDLIVAYGHLTDASKILSGLHSYDRITVVETGELLDSLTIHYSDHDETVDITSDRTISYDMLKDGEIILDSTLADEVTAGLDPRTVTGVITIERNGETLFNEGISVTVPAERKFFARMKMHWNRLMNRIRGGSDQQSG